jgi:hypothetical protein
MKITLALFAILWSGIIFAQQTQLPYTILEDAGQYATRKVKTIKAYQISPKGEEQHVKTRYFDDNGMITMAEVWSKDDNAWATYTYRYNEEALLIQLDKTMLDSTRVYATWKYDDNGRLLKEHYMGEKFGPQVEYSYDDETGRVDSTLDFSEGPRKYSWHYEDGKLVKTIGYTLYLYDTPVRWVPRDSVVYTYSDSGQLLKTEACKYGCTNEMFAYDPFGYLISATKTSEDGEIGKRTYQYDRGGLLIGETFTVHEGMEEYGENEAFRYEYELR